MDQTKKKERQEDQRIRALATRLMLRDFITRLQPAISAIPTNDPITNPEISPIPLGGPFLSVSHESQHHKTTSQATKCVIQSFSKSNPGAEKRPNRISGCRSIQAKRVSRKEKTRNAKERAQEKREERVEGGYE